MRCLDPMPGQEDLQRVAAEFREALKKTAGALSGALRARFESYPKEMCEFATNLLGRYLVENGVGGVRYVCGGRRLAGRPGDQRHAWLEVHGWLVDITADQFPDGLGPVIVTRDRSWHARFQLVEERAATDLSGYCPEAQKQYEDVFREVRSRLPAL